MNFYFVPCGFEPDKLNNIEFYENVIKAEQPKKTKHRYNVEILI